ncbi:bactofilin family protein [Psychroflexus salis]|uniref:Protein CcmA, bactofilin family n=1 Tax=Psychroflexus salis TaxID=1526574 RepID=A0A916ZL66_9FLAO|nr:polymer-forming cytoskeletal protein [Psychroflexus salis]GGE02989.1 hypothetical protein GCM10010831_00890 [Psychroflexus salis]
MLGSKKDKQTEDLTKEQNKIAQGTTFKGDIDSQGSFRIEGKVEGSITTAGKVVIGKTGYVEGNIQCEYADFEGKFSGEINVNATLSLKSTAVVEGKVVTDKLAVEPGAIFNASCKMKGAVKSLNEQKERQKQTGKKEQTA